ncbi:hypothetical protein MUK42_28834, partial [Musa troglodytarum]
CGSSCLPDCSSGPLDPYRSFFPVLSSSSRLPFDGSVALCQNPSRSLAQLHCCRPPFQPPSPLRPSRREGRARPAGDRGGGSLLGDRGLRDATPRGSHTHHDSSRIRSRLAALHPWLLLLGSAPRAPSWCRRAREQAHRSDDSGRDLVVHQRSCLVSLRLFCGR